jgi:ketosteroid isomerase-like protein
MGDREAILELIRRAYEARGRGDLDALMAAFHQDAVFTLIGDKKALEVTGTVHGHARCAGSPSRFHRHL